MDHRNHLFNQADKYEAKINKKVEVKLTLASAFIRISFTSTDLTVYIEHL